MELIDCIRQIPELLGRIRSGMPQTEQKIARYLAGRTVNEVVVVASGTSLNAGNVTRYFAQKVCGLKVTCVYPNMFLNYYDYGSPDTLYLIISQGGRTKLVYQCLEKIRRKNGANISITESLDTPIAELADLALEMGSGHEEFVYRTIGYSTTVATCMMAEMAIARQQGTLTGRQISAILGDFDKAAANLPNITAGAERWYARHQFSLIRRSKCILGGAGWLYETSAEAEIKMTEMVPMLAHCYELEEMIHGPQNAFDDNTIYFLLVDQTFDKEKVLAIKRFLAENIGFCALVGDVSTDENDLPFTYASKYFRMLEIITVFQVIAYRMATDRGRDLKRGVNSSLVNYIRKTI